jgi:hypothetical protein
VVVEYDDRDIDLLLSVLDKMDAFLTAAVVSNDINFQNKVFIP